MQTIEANAVEFTPLRKTNGYPVDLYVHLEIDANEERDNVPCAAQQIGEGDTWIMKFGIGYAIGDYCFAKTHAYNVIKDRPKWTATIRRINTDEIVYTAKGSNQ